MPILIADSGSTKTDWAFIKEDQKPFFLRTQGLNPHFTAKDVFYKVLEKEVLPHIHGNINVEIFFYGAGCGIQPNREAIDALFRERTLPPLESRELRRDSKAELLLAGILSLLLAIEWWFERTRYERSP